MLFIHNSGVNAPMGDSPFVPAMLKEVRPETLLTQRPGLNTKRRILALCL